MKTKTKKIIDVVFKTCWWVAFILLFVMVFGIVSAKFKGEVPNVFGYSVVRVTTPSMSDTIPADTYILLKKTAPKEIKENDIICFYSDDVNILGYPNTHRVEEVKIIDGKYEFVTKGDANAVQDSTTAKGDKLIGKYVKTLKGITWLSQALKAQGAIVVFVGVAIATMGIVVVTVIIKSKEENKNQ